MDRTTQQIIAIGHRPEIPAERIGRWMRIHYRALRVGRLRPRAARDPWIDHVSPWAFWGLHR
ncbi:hypothetical protein ABIC47_001178 [Leifsonia sp. 563]|uniref:hypothetical protein n=1 Tax=Leifsonia sp. 563 TaxID=3156412 RepID=UPI00339893D4